jgi:hypothetical protein
MIVTAAYAEKKRAGAILSLVCARSTTLTNQAFNFD